MFLFSDPLKRTVRMSNHLSVDITLLMYETIGWCCVGIFVTFI